MSQLASLTPDGADSTQVLTPALTPLSVREVLPWLLFAGLLLVVAWYLVSTEQGASALFAGNAVHEWVHDGRHLLGFPVTEPADMPSVRHFLVRGLLAGLVAGILTFAVAYVVGEPSIRAGIALEQAGAEPAGHDHAESSAEQGHDHADEGGTVVPRSLQATAGLLTATLLTGVTLGGVLGVLSALALGRFGRLRARGTTLLVTGTGFVALFVLPFVAYPPNPPAVGAAETIGLRTSLYVLMVAISLISGVTAVLTARHLARSWGAWYAALAAAAGYLLVTVTAMALLPTYDEVPAGFPATLLYEFRQASFVVQLTLWSVLGVTLAELLHRLTARPAAAATRPVEATGMRG